MANKQGVILTATIVGLGILAWLFFFSPGARQDRNAEAARDFAYDLRPKFQEDARFSSINLTHSVRDGGCLLVQGHISESDLPALKTVISECPVPVRWTLYDSPESNPDRRIVYEDVTKP